MNFIFEIAKALPKPCLTKLGPRTLVEVKTLATGTIEIYWFKVYPLTHSRQSDKFKRVTHCSSSMKSSPVSKKRIGANALSNLVGAILLTLVVVICTPVYIHIIGEARFGILALVWLLFGYFGLFDLGLSRATANKLAKAKDDSPTKRSTIFWTALWSNLALGICGAFIFLLVSKQLLSFYIKVPDAFTSEIDRGLPWIALLIPLLTINGVFVATLEASEEFIKLNILQITGSTIFQVLPLVGVVLIAPRIDVAILASAIGRAIAMFLTAVFSLRIIGFSNFYRIDLLIARQLFGYGGWVAVCSVVAPLLTTLDQFFIGTMISATAVAFYSVAYSIAGRANVIPLSLARALFPRLSQHNQEEAKALTMSSLKLLVLPTVLMYAGGILLSKIALQLWLGVDFAAQSVPVLQILLVGAWINGLAFIPYAMTQAQGRPDLVAKISLLEFIPYLIVLIGMISFAGLRGAAIAWTIRAAVDTVLQFKIARLPIKELTHVAFGFIFLIATAVIVETTNINVLLSLGLAAALFIASSIQMLLNPKVQNYVLAFAKILKFRS